MQFIQNGQMLFLLLLIID